jgi:hypothetical protein
MDKEIQPSGVWSNMVIDKRRAVMKKRAVLVSAMLGTLLLAIPVQSQAFFCGFGGGFGFGFGGGGWGYPYYAGYYPGYRGYGGYPYYAGYHRGYLGYGGYPHYAYRPYSLYSYPVVAAQPLVSAPAVAEK